MLFSLPLHLILAAYAVARSVPRMLPPWKGGGANVGDLFEFVCSLDECNYLACAESADSPVDLGDCSYIANLVETNGNEIFLLPEADPWTFTWNSCKARISTPVWDAISVCPEMLSKLLHNATTSCNGGLSVCANVFPHGQSHWAIGFYHS